MRRAAVLMLLLLGCMAAPVNPAPVVVEKVVYREVGYMVSCPGTAPDRKFLTELLGAN